MKQSEMPLRRGGGDLVALAALLGVLAIWYFGLGLFDEGGRTVRREEELRAASAMKSAIAALRAEAEARGAAPEPSTDPNLTGLIGLSWSSTTTTLGSLPAKRTAAQPDAAALMARFLWEAGVRPGSLVAVESSGSFPGFAIAALVASKSLGAKTVSVMSIGASTWGANRPGFTLPDMVYSLSKRGLLRVDRMAISPGGADDIGSDMDAQALGAALARVKAEGATLIDERDLGRDVAVKKAFLESRGKPAVLVSIGGNWAAAGPGEALLGRTGLLRASDFPGGVHGTGLIQAFLAEGIPVIRILDVQDLCVRTGLAFDPQPWPAEGSSNFYRRASPPALLVLAGPLVGILAAIAIRLSRSSGFASRAKRIMKK